LGEAWKRCRKDAAVELLGRVGIGAPERYPGRIVETAAAEDLFARPSHPHTQGPDLGGAAPGSELP
jgi:hypothetical protein